MSAWWVSWYSTAPLSTFELHSPWWVSGYRCSDDAETVCAAVRAETAEEAKAIVHASYDVPPTALEWRFAEVLEGSPFCDRFPQDRDWLVWNDDRTCGCPKCEVAA